MHMKESACVRTVRVVCTYSEGGIENMVQVDREEVEEALAAGSHHCVAGVVCVRPGIGALRQAAVGQLVQDPLWVGVEKWEK